MRRVDCPHGCYQHPEAQACTACSDTKGTPRARARLCAIQFFYRHAGWGYDPATETPKVGRMRGARRLATAEREAASMGCTAEWAADSEGCSGCECGSAECDCCSGADHVTEYCVLNDERGNPLASLSGICGATREYRRVVAAQLALESAS